MPRRPANPLTLALTLVVAAALPSRAQERPTLTPADYDRWQTASGAALDPTGRWAVESVRTVGGEVELRLHAVAGDTTLVLPRGSRPVFTDDGRWLLYIRGADDDADDGSPEAESRLVTVELAGPRVAVRHRASSFVASPDARWVASQAPPPADSVGADLTLLDLEGGAPTTLGNVDALAWRDDGALLALTFRTASGEGNGVALYEPASGRLQSLDTDTTRYRALSWRDDAGDLAALREVRREGRSDPGHDVLLWRGLDGSSGAEWPAPRILAADHPFLADSLRVIDAAGVSWSPAGDRVFVGLRSWPRDAAGDSAATDAADDDDNDDEIAPSEVQVWHWDDDRILRAQESSAGALARRSHLAAWEPDADRVQRLGWDLDEPVRPTASGRWGLVDQIAPYAFERRFGVSTRDIYRVDLATGERTLLAEGVSSGASVGPEGQRILVHDDGWVAIDLASLERTPIGEGSGAEFVRSLADHDYPGPRPPWGVGGWSTDGSVAWLLDRHDLWRADLESGTARRVTPGAADGRQFRIVNLDPEAEGLDPDAPLLLRFVNLETRATGYAQLRGDDELRVLLAEEAEVGGLRRAADAPVHLLTRQRFDLSPQLLVAGVDLAESRVLSTTNDFQSDYAWGRNELLHFTTDAGHDLQAILTYPADFDPTRSYPLILYQYERLSQGLHRYVAPSQTSYYNVQVWSQAGYFVLQPDILYEPGRPGPSALDAVEHALDAALAAAPIDDARMGLIGHSWGGYQAAYIPTRMHRFAASVAGAAITNFLSFPGSVHWNGGLPELGHWETGQARMARPPWDDLEGHLESSPVAAIHELQTPVLLMHGDADGVVDFGQGLEFYNYARRLGKPVILLMYPGADHGLRREENQVDYQTRILEWFAHWLKGEPAAAWITEGEDWETRARRLDRTRR